MALVEPKTLDEITQELKVRRLDLEDERRKLDSEGKKIERALAALSPTMRRRGPGRPRKDGS